MTRLSGDQAGRSIALEAPATPRFRDRQTLPSAQRLY